MIVLIDDDAVSAAALSDSLTAEGHQVRVASTVEAGMSLVLSGRPDLVLLELAVGGNAGLKLCRYMKQNPATASVPLIAVTTLNDEIDRVVAFEIGVDDYIGKPFSAREVNLRVRGVLRRCAISSVGDGPLQCGRIRIDRLAHRAWVDEEPIDLSHLEFKILVTLCEHGNRVLSREALVKSAWGTDASVSARTVDAYVKRLRQKLGNARHSIETVRGVGYRLTLGEDRQSSFSRASHMTFTSSSSKRRI